jgi:hypothetical protein
VDANDLGVFVADVVDADDCTDGVVVVVGGCADNEDEGGGGRIVGIDGGFIFGGV